MSIARLMQMAAAGVPKGEPWLADLANASYDGVSFSVAGQESFPSDLFFKPDGTKMYILGQTTNDAVYEYNLSTAWDISTASYVQLFSFATEETVPQGLSFKPDGLKMYVIGSTGDDVNEYNLSTAWDISTASFVQNFSVAAQETVPSALFFRADGAKMYILGANGDDVSEYNLSTGWDISTATYLQNFSVETEDATPLGTFFNPDGLKMYVIGTISDAVYEYTLSTAWDISTASYSGVSFSVGGQDTGPSGLFFKPDGTKMYFVGTTGDAVYQYTTA